MAKVESETQKDKASDVGYPFSSGYAKLRELILNSDPAYVTLPWDESEYMFPATRQRKVRARVTVR